MATNAFARRRQWTKFLAMGWIALTAGGVQAASPTSAAWDLRPRYQVGQELVYEGRIQDVQEIEGVRSESERRLCVRALVMEKSAKGYTDLGCYTVHKLPEIRADQKPNDLEDAIDVHFDLVQVGPDGHARWAGSGAEIAPPTEPATIAEFGYLLPAPDQPVRVGDKWVMKRTGQTNTRYTVEGVESIIGARCVVIAFDQESHNWTNEDISLGAWHLTGKVWFDTQSQSIVKLERELHTRDPAAPLARNVRRVVYEQTSAIKFHGSVLQDQIADFRDALAAQDQLQQALNLSDATRERMLLAVRQDLKEAMQKMHATSYRPAIERMYKMAEAAPSVAETQGTGRAPVLTGRREARLGQRAPHFVFKTTRDGEKISRTSMRGQSLLMVFVDPNSELSREALRTALAASEGSAPDKLRMLVVCPKADSEAEAILRHAVPGDYEVCSGASVDFGVRGTPHVVFIDSAGILRMNQYGFGPEVHRELAESLSKVSAANIADQKSKSPSYLR